MDERKALRREGVVAVVAVVFGRFLRQNETGGGEVGAWFAPRGCSQRRWWVARAANVRGGFPSARPRAPEDRTPPPPLDFFHAQKTQILSSPCMRSTKAAASNADGDVVDQRVYLKQDGTRRAIAPFR